MQCVATVWVWRAQDALLHKLTRCGSTLPRRWSKIRLWKVPFCRSAAATETLATEYCAEAAPEGAAASAAAPTSAKVQRLCLARFRLTLL